MDKDFFKNDEYWKTHIHRTLEEDWWIDEYRALLPASGTVLDLGCGIGQYTKRFQEYGYHVISADISETALAAVRTFNPSAVWLDMRAPFLLQMQAFQSFLQACLFITFPIG